VAATYPKYLSRPANFVIRPAPGWVDLTGGEVTEITAAPFGKYKFVPEFKADKGAIHAANVDFRQALDWCMRLRTAHDVEWLAWEGKCGSWRDLGKACESLKALGFLPAVPEGQEGASVHVAVKANTSFVVTSGTIREKFIELLGVKQTEDAALRFRLDLYRDRLRVLVSLAGEPLYKRGYKKHLTSAAAPLPEHQAAGCIRTTLVTLAADSTQDLEKASQEISRKIPFDGVYVPFAGTGTLAFEWLATQLDLGGGSFGRHYAFESFAGIPGTTVAHIRKKMSEARAVSGGYPASAGASALLPPVLCIERNAEALSDLRDNAVHFCDLAGIDSKAIEVAAGDFFKSDSETALRVMASSGRSILMLLNPPYGQRLKAPAEAKKYFGRIASHIVDLEVRTGASFSGMCLIPEEPASAAFVKSLKGTHKTTTVHFTHGGSDIRLVVFGPA